MPSFDTVSEINHHEVANAIDQAAREIEQRFDLRGTGAAVKLEKAVITCIATADFQLKQVREIVEAKLIKRGIDISCLDEGKVEGAGKELRQTITVREGIDQEHAKKIVALIKDAKLKVQASIQGDKVRVTGKKRDDLQEAIALMREGKIGIPLQFNNFRD
ncbi:MAG: YajQ family cyclic di-GMP-binding protein [Gammaproteobacteria bacterium]